MFLIFQKFQPADLIPFPQVSLGEVVRTPVPAMERIQQVPDLAAVLP
jgi:hypothetical protein